MTEEPRLRTWVVAFEADDGTAEVAAVVVGSVLENFRGLRLAEFQDETALGDNPGATAVDVLHEVLTSRPLSRGQLELVRELVNDIEEWNGDEK